MRGRGATRCGRSGAAGAARPAADRDLAPRPDDRGYWKAAGCSSRAQWLAQITSSDYRTARGSRRRPRRCARCRRSTRPSATGDADARSGRGRGAVRDARDRCRDRARRGRQGAQRRSRSRRARSCRPKVADDQELYARRALRTTWTDGGRELVFSGQLPLEHGAAFEQAICELARTQRADDKQSGTILDWQQSTADALVTLARQARRRGRGRRLRRSPTTLIVHLSDDARRRCSKAPGRSAPRPPRGSPATRAGSRSSPRIATSSTHASDAAPPTRSDARSTSAHGHCQYPGCTSTRELDAHHLVPAELGGATDLANLILLCYRHHKHLHDHHIHTSGPASSPVVHGRRRPRGHRQPATRTAGLTRRAL